MRQKQKKLIFGIGLALFLGVLILSQTGFDFPLAISGTNTLSLSQAQLQSSNSFLNGKAWLLTFSSGGLGQRYTGTFSPSDVQSSTSDSSTTTKPFTIDVEYSDQTCNYAIQQTSLNKPIYDIIYKTWTYVPLIDSCNFDEAKSRGIATPIWTIKPTGITCYGIGYNSQSPVGNLQNPNLESEFTISINADGKTATKTINTLSGSTQGAVGDFAYASWLGNLVSGQSCPSQSPYKSAYVGGTWKVIDSNAYNTYKSRVESVPPTSSGDTLRIWINNLMSSVSNAKLSKSFGSINSATSLSSAVVKITLQNQIQFPVTTLYIKADTIGIYTPTPEIKLVNADSSCFQTGEQGGITVELQNIGQEAGTWNIFAQCQSPFTSNSNLQVSLQPGATITKVIPISASASSEQKASCTIFAESPAGTKQLNADVCVKPQIICTANAKFCAISGTSEVVKQCSSDGATSSIIQVCGVGETCEIDKCAVDSGGGGIGIGGFFDKIKNFFNNLFGGFFTGLQLIRLGFVVVVGIIGSIFSKDIISSFRALRRKEGVAWILGIVIGGIIAVITYTLFWFGIVVFGIVLLIRLTPIGRLMR